MIVKYLGESNSLTFINGKLYTVIGKENELYRIIDETGEDYLYSLNNFVMLELKRFTFKQIKTQQFRYKIRYVLRKPNDETLY
jgi:hypothetical protein